MFFPLEQIISLLETYKYVLLFPLVVIEGPMTMILSGFFYKLGYIEIIPAYLILLLGDITGDALWYSVGYFGARRFIKKHGKFFNVTENILEKIELQFRYHQNKILLISKTTMGFGFALAILSIAGAVKVPFKKFIILNILGGLVWIAFLLLIGYFFGNFYDAIAKKFQIVFLIFIATIISVMIYGFSRYMRKKFIQNKI